ncbi:MAG: GIY-YIG nuclease family protein [Burkholderiales bacterium]|nr:GIY-YIG nuclease family protein [Burkholderiales bacterium]
MNTALPHDGIVRCPAPHSITLEQNPAQEQQPNRRGKKPRLAKPWSRHSIRQTTQACFLYLFVHKVEPRLKIGISIEPIVRLSQLEEAGEVDVSRSLVVRLDCLKRARELECMLHKALSPHRLNPDIRRRHDGDTEWFAMSALPLATQLILEAPNSSQSVGFLLESLALHASLAEQSKSPAICDESISVRQLQVAQSVSRLLMRVAQSLTVEVVGHTDQARSQAAVVLRGFKTFGCGVFCMTERRHKSHRALELEVLTLRMKVLDIETYQLPARMSPSTPLTWAPPPSLVRSVSFGAGKDIGGCTASSNDLVIRFTSPHAIRALSGGHQLEKAVDILLSQLSLITHLNERALSFHQDMSSRAM